MMVVAVTGANGVVGSAIVQKLEEQKIQVRRVVRPETDVLDMPALVKAFDGIDAVVHAAGLVSFNPRDKQRLFDINVQGTRNIVNACLVNGTKQLVHISSVAALGRHRNNKVIDEETRWIQGMPASDYAQSKYLSELEVFRGMEEGLKVAVVNPSVVLSAGDGQRSSSRLFGYVWRERRLYSDFNLNYVDARDVAEIVVRLLRSDYNGERFIANGGIVSMTKIFTEVARRFKKRAPSIKIPAALAGVAARLEEIRSAITGNEPAITRQSVKALREQVVFENLKAKEKLGMEFQSLETTLDWCCDMYRTVNINK